MLIMCVGGCGCECQHACAKCLNVFHQSYLFCMIENVVLYTFRQAMHVLQEVKYISTQ